MIIKNNTISWFIDTTKKSQNLKNYNKKIYWELKSCNLWLLSQSTPERVLFCSKNNRCWKDRICPECATIKRQKRYKQYKQVFSNWVIDTEKSCFLTLTLLHNQDLFFLWKQVRTCISNINKLKKNKKSVFYLFSSIILSIENKKDKKGLWNTHLHCVVITKKKQKIKTLEDKIKKEWKQISGAKEIKIEPIQWNNKINKEKNILKVIDYMWKCDIKSKVCDRVEVMKVFYSIPMFRVYGKIKEELKKTKTIYEKINIVPVIINILRLFISLWNRVVFNYNTSICSRYVYVFITIYYLFVYDFF